MSDIMLERSRTVKDFFDPRFEFFDILPFSEEPLMARVSRMTIAAGFRCKDGVVICADREITTGTGKLPKEKIWTADYDKLSVVVTGAGIFPHMESAAEKIIKRLKSSTPNKAAEIVRATFKSVYENEYFTKDSSSHSVPFDLIVGVSSPKRVQIIRMEQGVLKVDRPVELAGTGRPWAQYFFDIYHHSPSLSDGIVLGAYIIYVVKKSGLGCGGSTDLWVIQSGKPAKHIPAKYLDSAFASLHIPFRDLLFGFSNLGLSDIEFDKELQRIGRLLKTRRAAYKRKWHRPISIIAEEIPE